MTKTDFDVKLSSLNRKITTIITIKLKHLLVENELKRLTTFDLIHFRGKNYFEEDGAQNYLVFQQMYKYLQKTSNTDNISE